MPQNSKIAFACSTEVHDKLIEKARQSGLSLKNYLIRAGLSAEINTTIKFNSSIKDGIKANGKIIINSKEISFSELEIE